MIILANTFHEADHLQIKNIRWCKKTAPEGCWLHQKVLMGKI